jgi:uncharacterized coiled-coil DUF342 family protein
MDSIFEAIGVAAIPIIVIHLLLRWQKTSDQEKSLQWHSQKLAEYAARIKELEATIVSLNKEIEENNRLIDELNQDFIDLSKEVDRKDKQIQLFGNLIKGQHELIKRLEEEKS